MATTSTETEIKYDAPDDLVVPALDELPAVSRTRQEADEHLEAVYYDTDDLRLIRAGITLRRRRGGHDEGWHLKMPAGVHARREIQVPLGDDDAGVPDELADRIRVHARGKAVRPRAVISTRRQRLILLGESGTSLAELAVDDVRARRKTRGKETHGKTESSWREVELQLTGGDHAVLDAVDKLLLQSGLRRSASSAKFERVVGAVREDYWSRPRLSAASSAGEVVLSYVASQAETLKSLDPLVRRNEPDAVHQMRVTTRRLRSTLQTFGKLVWTGDTSQLAAELKWAGGLLGTARDAEVLAGKLLTRLDGIEAELVIGPVRARVRAQFEADEASALAEVRAGLDSRRYFALLDALDALVAQPPPASPASPAAAGPLLTAAAGKPATTVLPAAVRRASRRASRRMRHALLAPAGTARQEALHQARKATKRVRYAAELAAPAIGSDARRFAKRMKQVQSTLGEHQDSVIARGVERQLAISAGLAGENAFTYGLLYQLEVEAGRKARARARKQWKRASRRRYRHWLA